MGPSAEYSESCSKQAFRCRERRCLLKGCEQSFCPSHPLARYCSAACQEAARRWSRTCANRRYRATERGKQQRREQAQRYRERVRQRREPVPSGDPEGYQEERRTNFSFCQRPGCYVLFPMTSRSPRRKFCCASCRNALRRVLRRERHWRQRLQRRLMTAVSDFDSS